MTLYDEWSSEFTLRTELTSRLMLSKIQIDKDKKDNIKQLIKSNLYTDLILAEEIMNTLAI